MKEAQINLPILGNNGKSLGAAHTTLENMLVTLFGGCTRTIGVGMWQGEDKLYREDVYCYMVAMEATPGNRSALQGIADAIKLAARQDAMYVCHADGDVIIS